MAAFSLPVLAALPGVAQAQTAEDARRFIENLAQRAITTVADRQLSQSERDDRFRTLFVSAFDIPEIGRFVLSRHWRMATTEQQHDFLTLFERITVLTWAKRFRDYDGERLETISAGREGDRGWMVDSRIQRPQGPPVSTQWRLRQEDDGSFRVVDIIAEGVSMAITLRSDYAAIMHENGGQMNGLLSAIRTKIDQLKSVN
ncbi:MAG: ABC transporter substrate-binding protein [Telmatospirillum sp.]|nr:ABC transporter substrate-binding protein [Telmatospirillum sp.]